MLQHEDAIIPDGGHCGEQANYRDGVNIFLGVCSHDNVNND